MSRNAISVDARSSRISLLYPCERLTESLAIAILETRRC